MSRECPSVTTRARTGTDHPIGKRSRAEVVTAYPGARPEPADRVFFVQQWHDARGRRSPTRSSISRCSTTTWRRSPRRVTRSRARSPGRSATARRTSPCTMVKDFETERPAFSNDRLVQQLLDNGVKVNAEPDRPARSWTAIVSRLRADAVDHRPARVVVPSRAWLRPAAASAASGARGRGGTSRKQAAARPSTTSPASTRPRTSSTRSSTSSGTPTSTAARRADPRRACCSPGRPAPARRCSPARSPARPTCRSSRSRRRSSSR